MRQIIQPVFQSIVNIVRFPISNALPLIYTKDTYCSSLVVFAEIQQIRGILFEPGNVLLVCPQEKISAQIKPKKDVANIWFALMEDVNSAYLEANRRAGVHLRMDNKLIQHILFDEHSPYAHKQVVHSGVRERGPARVFQEYEVGNKINELAFFFSVEDVIANLGL